MNAVAARNAIPMPIVDIEGLPYVAQEWLQRRIYRDEVRAKRWRQEARRMGQRTDRVSMELRAAYLWHALQAEYRAEKWRRCLRITISAIENRQINSRIDFGSLLRDRRLAAGYNLRSLAARSGLDHKTILNIENASFQPTKRSIERLIAVDELRLSWDDVSQYALEANSADGVKRRQKRRI